MTLAAVILIFGASWGQFFVPLQANAASQSPAQTTSTGDSQTQPAQAATPDSKQSSTTSSSQKQSNNPAHPAAKKPVRKKKVVAADCGGAATGGPSAPASTSTDTKTDASTSGNASAANSGTASKNCPPEKIVVRQGGTTEPSIQLAGGAGGDDASQKRDATHQMLGEAEGNLKKVASQQLSANQQDGVTQIRQFIEESKNALAAGDVEQARTLAWKAKLLSEDLVKPPQ
jgi:hypothetical protein